MVREAFRKLYARQMNVAKPYNDERFNFYALASKDSNKKHVTAYRHMTKCRLRWRICPGFFVSKRRTMLSRMAPPAAFLCTETPRPTQNSRFILNSSGISMID